MSFSFTSGPFSATVAAATIDEAQKKLSVVAGDLFSGGRRCVSDYGGVKLILDGDALSTDAIGKTENWKQNPAS